MTVREVLDAMKKELGTAWSGERGYRDNIKVGSADAVVTGIATTWMASINVIKKAHAAKLNFIINHEDTWWTDRDDTKDLGDNKLYKLKRQYCLDNGIVIWRFHDGQHARRPDQSVVAELKLAGIVDENAAMQSGLHTIPETTLGALASLIKKNARARAIRVAGDPKMKVTKILVGPGYGTPRFSAEADVVIGGESQEADGSFDNVGYAADAAALGIAKGVIMLGHGVSEEPGMGECAKWLRTFITGIPIEHVPAGEPYWT
jgi:putative NIF3 family GTP cyclohydrolase 1 type 2